MKGWGLGLIAAVFLVVGAWVGQLFGGGLEDELAEARSQAAAAESRARGFETRLVDVEDELATAYASVVDTSIISSAFRAEVVELVTQVELLQGRVATITEMYAELRDSFVFPVTDVDELGDEVTEIRGAIDEPGLRLRVAYLPPASAFRLDELGIAGVLVVSQVPDGRQLVSARAESPRIAFTGLETYVAAAVVERRCPLGTRVTWGGVGLGIGAALGLAASVAN